MVCSPYLKMIQEKGGDLMASESIQEAAAQHSLLVALLIVALGASG
jgi:hypothetical protein